MEEKKTRRKEEEGKKRNHQQKPQWKGGKLGKEPPSPSLPLRVHISGLVWHLVVRSVHCLEAQVDKERNAGVVRLHSLWGWMDK